MTHIDMQIVSFDVKAIDNLFPANIPEKSILKDNSPFLRPV